MLRNEWWALVFKHLQWWELCSGFVSSKTKQLSMRRCDGWGNKDNEGNSEAASLGAAPFLKKALWVLRHLHDQESALQPLFPNVSEVTAVCCLVSERVISGTHPFKLMLAACYSTAERFIHGGVALLKVSWPLHCAPEHTCIFEYVISLQRQHVPHKSHTADPPHFFPYV